MNDHEAGVDEKAVPTITPVAHLPHPFNGDDESGAAVYEFSPAERPDVISVMVQGAFGDRMTSAFFRKSDPLCAPEDRGRLQPVALLDHPRRNARSLTRVFHYDLQCADGESLQITLGPRDQKIGMDVLPPRTYPPQPGRFRPGGK